MALSAPDAPSEVSVADALELEASESCLEHDRLTQRIVMWLKRDTMDARLSVVVRDDPSVHGVRYLLMSHGEVIAGGSGSFVSLKINPCRMCCIHVVPDL